MGRKGLIGEKLGHSYSKIIHEQLADYTYDLIPLSAEEFPRFMEARDFDAINVTIPYKQKVIPYLDEMDENAAAIGAVNTIVNKSGHLIGHNTDYSGFVYLLSRAQITVTGKKVLVLGNGGAAKAVLAVLKNQKAAQIVITKPRPSAETITTQECYQNHTDAQIVINTSPVGMYPQVDQSPLDLSRFPDCKAVVDIIYNPLTTKLLAQGKSLGMRTANGLSMLVAQALYAAEFFLDRKLPEEKIDSVLQKLEKGSLT